MGGPAHAFLTTNWTLFRHRDMEQIVRLYWRPVYAFLRRKGHSVEDAKDFTQGFFTRFLEKDYASQVNQSRGRFRSFLRVAVEHFVSDELDRARAKKRGGGAVLPLDVKAAEELLSVEEPPERHFDRQWARAILDDVSRELEEEYRKRGQSDKFAEIRPHLAGGSHQDRSALHRARKRFGELVRRRVVETVRSPSDVDEEIGILFDSLRQSGPISS